MRRFRIECVCLNKEPAETAWDNIADSAQAVLRSCAPEVSVRQLPGGWQYHSDEWHHWTATFDPVAWCKSGTLIFAAMVALMLRNDPALLDFAVMLFYSDGEGAGAEWIECG